jgi:hypothetical protein
MSGEPSRLKMPNTISSRFPAAKPSSRIKRAEPRPGASRHRMPIRTAAPTVSRKCGWRREAFAD